MNEQANSATKITLSPLGHVWLLDIDGTIARHNGYLAEGDSVLPESLTFLHAIPDNDYIVFLTSRGEECAGETEDFLTKNGIRFDQIVYGLPYGERILINDSKPSGLKTAHAINVERDQGVMVNVEIDDGI